MALTVTVSISKYSTPSGRAFLQDNQDNGFISGAFAHNFGCKLGGFGLSEADEERVGNAEKRVVDAVGMDVFNSTFLEVSKDGGDNDGMVYVAISVGGYGHPC